MPGNLPTHKFPVSHVLRGCILEKLSLAHCEYGTVFQNSSHLIQQPHGLHKMIFWVSGFRTERQCGIKRKYDLVMETSGSRF